MGKKRNGKMNKQASWIARGVYLLAGAVGIGSAIWAGMNWTTFVTEMGIVANIAFGVATIASVNWLPVGITGKRDMDLFGIIGL